MKKKFNIWMALFAAIALVFAVGCKSNGADSSTGGSTTRYVGSADDLIAWAEKVNSGEYDLNCTLTGDIDMDGKTWTPVGTYYDKYTGTFDGNGHTISNLTVSIDNNNFSDVAGLIGYLGSGGTVTGLGLENVNMSAYNAAGGVVARNFGGTIAGCWTSGTVTGLNAGIDIANELIGGITGQNRYGGTVIACYSTATVVRNYSGGGSVGGIVGRNGDSRDTYDDKIIGCYFAGNVSSYWSYFIGAVAGINYSNGTINASYWSGNDDVEGVGSSNSSADVSGTASVMKVTGDVTWEDAQTAMNNAIDTSLSAGWYYDNATTSEAPTLVQN